MVNILQVKTIQSGAFKTLIEALQTLLNDVNFNFTPLDPSKYEEVNDRDSDVCDDSSDCDNSESSGDSKNFIQDNQTQEPQKKVGGLKINAVNKNKTIYIHVKLDADKFDYYECIEAEITLGINLSSLYRNLKCMTNVDTITLSLEDESREELKIMLENGEKNQKITSRLNLVDLEKLEYNIRPIKFPYKIDMPSVDFHNHCKNMMTFSNKMEIICTSKKVEFKCKGEQGVVCIEIGQADNGLSIASTDTETKIVQGEFELKFLVLFTKCTNLGQNVSLYLENDCVLIVKYDVAALGDIKLCLAPNRKEDVL
jgi:proliferating cell nuclear antigen